MTHQAVRGPKHQWGSIFARLFGRPGDRMPWMGMIDALEGRRLLTNTISGGVLTIEGTAGDDVVSVTRSGGDLLIDVNGVMESLPIAGSDPLNPDANDINTLTVNLLDGNDAVDLNNVDLQSTLSGGAGNDTLQGGVSNDDISGNDGNDVYVFTVPWGADTVREQSAEGMDTLDFSGVADPIQGIIGNNTLNIAGPSDVVLLNSQHVEAVISGSGNDFFSFIDGGTFGGTISGGLGDNTLVYEPYQTSVTVNLGTQTATGLGGLSNFSSVIGGAAGDSITGDAGSNLLAGGPGNDTIAGGAGNDQYAFGVSWGMDSVVENPGDGEDSFDFSAVTSALTVNVGTGNSDDGTNSVTVTGGSVDNYTGGSGDDTFVFPDGASISGSISGGGGSNTFDYSAYTTGVTVDLGGNNATGVSGLSGVTGFIGGSSDDQFNIPAGVSVTIDGGLGNDGGNTPGTNMDDDLTIDVSEYLNVESLTVAAGAGNDTIRLNNVTRALTVLGEDGNDTVIVNGSPDADTFTLGAIDVTVGASLVSLTDVEARTINGNDGDDTLVVAQGLTLAATADLGAGEDTVDITATAAADTIEVSATTVSGLGADLTHAGAETFLLNAGDGDDAVTLVNVLVTLDGGAGTDGVTVEGTSGDDAISVDGADFTAIESIIINGLDGSDSIAVANLPTTTIVDGGNGNDSLAVSATSGDDTIVIDAGTISGVGATITYINLDSLSINALDGADGITVEAITGDSLTVNAGAGNDTLTADNSQSLLYQGSDGTDDLIVNGTSAGDSVTVTDTQVTRDGRTILRSDVERLTVNALAGDDTINAFGTTGSNNLFGGDGNDSITAGTADDSIEGGDGNDTLAGGEGNDTIKAGGGNDHYLFEANWGTDAITENAGEGTDTFDFSALTDHLVVAVQNRVVTQGANSVTGGTHLENIATGTGNDQFVFANGATIGGTLNGGGGVNVLDYRAYGAGIAVSLAAGTATGTGGVSSFQNIIGGRGNDTLTGNNAANELSGLKGNDLVSGGSGNDTLFGGRGKDSLSGQGGNDSMAGGGGADVLIGGGGNDTLDGGTASDSLDGGAGLDRLLARDQTTDTVTGGGGRDTGVVDRRSKDVLNSVEEVL